MGRVLRLLAIVVITVVGGWFTLDYLLNLSGGDELFRMTREHIESRHCCDRPGEPCPELLDIIYDLSRKRGPVRERAKAFAVRCDALAARVVGLPDSPILAICSAAANEEDRTLARAELERSGTISAVRGELCTQRGLDFVLSAVGQDFDGLCPDGCVGLLASVPRHPLLRDIHRDHAADILIATLAALDDLDAEPASRLLSRLRFGDKKLNGRMITALHRGDIDERSARGAGSLVQDFGAADAAMDAFLTRAAAGTDPRSSAVATLLLIARGGTVPGESLRAALSAAPCRIVGLAAKRLPWDDAAFRASAVPHLARCAESLRPQPLDGTGAIPIDDPFAIAWIAARPPGEVLGDRKRRASMDSAVIFYLARKDAPDPSHLRHLASALLPDALSRPLLRRHADGTGAAAAAAAAALAQKTVRIPVPGARACLAELQALVRCRARDERWISRKCPICSACGGPIPNERALKRLAGAAKQSVPKVDGICEPR
jgi:hypothetical protein